MPGGYKNIKPSDGKPFQKGQSGNPKGATKKIPALDKLLEDLLGEDESGESGAKEVIRALQKKAKAGDVRAAEVLLERIYGKVKQQLDVNAEVNSQVTWNVTKTYAGPSESDI